MVLEAGDVVLPELAILFCPLCNFLDSLRLELVKALAPFLLLTNEARSSQDPEMF